MVAPLDDPEYETLWEEFCAGSTREARLVLAADKLEMIIQAWEYECTGVRTLEEFFSNPANRPNFEEFPVIEAIAAAVIARRRMP
jgi:putative hydrolase of HD superfamily